MRGERIRDAIEIHAAADESALHVVQKPARRDFSSGLTLRSTCPGCHFGTNCRFGSETEGTSAAALRLTDAG
jgi:hypothetical protein